MAFTTAQKLSIVKILGITPTFLDAHLSSLGATLTVDIETAVIAEIARWDASTGTDFVRVHPKERNFGAEINPNDAKNDIRKNIAIYLELTDLVVGISTTMGTLQIG